MTMHLFTKLARPTLCLLLAAVGAMASPARADDDDNEHAPRTPRAPLLQAYKQECASCHLAYPPGMLPAASWQRIMQNLPRHFGTDASLDAATGKQISSWLLANAGTHRRVQASAPPEDRISKSAWFIRQHDEVSASTWKRPSVKSPANCAACHTQAEQGDFNEHAVRIPR